jgi:thiol-disulfide isomerase/thioredoxin
MMNLKIFYLSLLFSITIANGCDSQNPKEKPETGNTKIVSKIEFIDQAGLKNLITNRNGKILLLNVWATWCPPCIEEFPDLVRIYNTYNDDKFEILGISVDEPDEINSKVIPFLNKNKVPFKVYLAKLDNEEKFINALNSSWNGAIPATFIYDSAGRQKYFSIGMKTYEQFEKEIKKVK